MARVGHDRGLALAEDQDAADRVGVGEDHAARLELALEQRPRQWVLHETLDRPLQRPGPVGRVRPFGDDQ